MNKRVLGLTIAIFALAVMSTPALAIGPQKAVKTSNPNAVFQPFAVQLRLPSGVLNEWVSIAPVHNQIKRPSDFHLGHFNVPTNPSEVLENKWNFLSEAVFYQYMISLGTPEEQAFYIAYVVYAGGVYLKVGNVGN
jgi:hypothetical protein